jgi:hypothetical protein
VRVSDAGEKGAIRGEKRGGDEWVLVVTSLTAGGVTGRSVLTAR